MLESPESVELDLLPCLRDSADRLCATAKTLDEPAVRGPSLLPGWSRAHVLAHLAGAARSRIRLLTAARTGRPMPQYRSAEARADQIETDAARPAAELFTALCAAADGVLDAIGGLPGDAWERDVDWLDGAPSPARTVVPSLLRELEIHHVDLDAGYRPSHWPSWFVLEELHGVVDRFDGEAAMPGLRLRATDQPVEHDFGPGPLVTGAGHDLLAWLIGRSPGLNLTTTPPVPFLPSLPPWKR